MESSRAPRIITSTSDHTVRCSDWQPCSMLSTENLLRPCHSSLQSQQCRQMLSSCVTFLQDCSLRTLACVLDSPTTTNRPVQQGCKAWAARAPLTGCPVQDVHSAATAPGRCSANDYLFRISGTSRVRGEGVEVRGHRFAPLIRKSSYQSSLMTSQGLLRTQSTESIIHTVTKIVSGKPQATRWRFFGIITSAKEYHFYQ